MTQEKKINIAILGASGYTGAELIRLLSRHPLVTIKALSGDKKAGQPLADVFPHLSMLDLPLLQKIDDIDFTDIDCVFCALPHGLTQNIVLSLPKHVKIVDLSADFRLRNADDYEKWYGNPHIAMDLQEKFVYGLPEFYRADIKGSQYVANTGCYVASSLLALLPLMNPALLQTDSIVIDAKSGASGAGRTAKENLLFTEIHEGFSAYSVASHRHSGEINQELSRMAGVCVTPTFTPHLLPQNRCILSTIYAHLQGGVTAHNVYETLKNIYANEYFIRVLPLGTVPHTHFVKGSNFVMLGVVADAVNPKRVKIISVLDNLIKGASGQAIQNMNIMYDFPEQLGLEQCPLFP